MDATAFIAEARAKLGKLTGVAPEPIKVGDRARYADTPRAQKLGWIGLDFGYVASITENLAISNSGSRSADYSNLLEVNSWIEWAGGECPVEGDAFVEVMHRDGEANEATASVFASGTNWWKHEGSEANSIVKYRIIKRR